jgi:hypothetical protein
MGAKAQIISPVFRTVWIGRTWRRRAGGFGIGKLTRRDQEKVDFAVCGPDTSAVMRVTVLHNVLTTDPIRFSFEESMHDG